MKRQPITQRAKSSPLHVNEALISGAAQTSRRFANPLGNDDPPGDGPKMTKTVETPGNTETITTGGDREVEELADPKDFEAQMAAEAKARGFKGTVQEYIEKKEQDLGYSPKEEEVYVPGKKQTEQMPYFTKKRTDVFTSPKTRDVGRKGKIMNRQAGKLGKQQANLEKRLYEKGGRRLERLDEKIKQAEGNPKLKEYYQNKKNKFEDRLKRNPSYQKLKNKLEATKETAEAYDNFMAAQNAATSTGKAFGRRDVGYGSRQMGYPDFSVEEQRRIFADRPFNTSKSNEGSDVDSGVKNQIRNFTSKYSPDYDFNTPSVTSNVSLGPAITPEKFDMGDFKGWQTNQKMTRGGSGINMNSKAPFKMKGYGSKARKK